MNQFNNLPPETIEFIFKKVNPNDLINLRIVDKRFKQICDQIKIKQLCVSYYLDDYSFDYPFWFYTNDPTYFNKKNLIEFSKFQKYTKIFQLDKHLKRLSLNIDNFNFSILNQFKLLEQLRVTTNKLNDNYKLSLDHLKIADFHLRDIYLSSLQLTFDTIKLFAFKLKNWYSKNKIVFNYPDKILFFELDCCNLNLACDYLKCFNNLQYLKLSGFYGSIERNILSQLKNLKILDLYRYAMLFLDLSILFLKENNLVQGIKYLINEKGNLKRSELEIYFNGVKLINQNNQLKFACDSAKSRSNLLEFQIKNYDLLKDNCEGYKINYCDLIKLIKILPSSFTNKFPFIHEVKATNYIDNEDQFIKFLNNLKYLSKLELINCGLTKSFYDQLIDSVYLNDLKILKIEEKKDLEMNFDFISNLKQLKEFKANQIITNHIDLIDKLFKQNENILLFDYKCDSKNYIQINTYCDYIASYYLDDNLKKVYNFSIDNLNRYNVISKLKEIKF